jgi:hypothetical protein
MKHVRAATERHQAEPIMFVERTEASFDGLLGLLKGNSRHRSGSVEQNDEASWSAGPGTELG